MFVWKGKHGRVIYYERLFGPCQPPRNAQDQWEPVGSLQCVCEEVYERENEFIVSEIQQCLMPEGLLFFLLHTILHDICIHFKQHVFISSL